MKNILIILLLGISLWAAQAQTLQETNPATCSSGDGVLEIIQPTSGSGTVLTQGNCSVTVPSTDCTTGCTQTLTGSEQNVTINSGEVYCLCGSASLGTVTLNGGELKLGAGGTISTLAFNGGSITSNGSLTVATLNQGVSGMGSFNVLGDLVVNSGSFNGQLLISGTTDFKAGGVTLVAGVSHGMNGSFLISGYVVNNGALTVCGSIVIGNDVLYDQNQTVSVFINNGEVSFYGSKTFRVSIYNSSIPGFQNNGVWNDVDPAFVSSGGNTTTCTVEWFDIDGQSLGTNLKLENLNPGSYSANVTCGSQSTTFNSTLVAQTNTLSFSLVKNENTGCTSSITVENITGGLSPYTYTLDNNASQNTPTFANLCEDTYDVKVTDAGGCEKIESITITVPVVTDSVVDPTTCTSNDGSLTVDPNKDTGGTVLTGICENSLVSVNCQQGCTQTLANGQSATINSGEVYCGCDLSNLGSITLNGGTLKLSGDVTISNLAFNSGNIEGAADLIVTNLTQTLSGLATFKVFGEIIVQSGDFEGRIAETGSADFLDNVTLVAGQQHSLVGSFSIHDRLTNNGTLSLCGAIATGDDWIYRQDSPGASFINNGTVNFYGSKVFWTSPSSGSAFENNGVWNDVDPNFVSSGNGTVTCSVTWFSGIQQIGTGPSISGLTAGEYRAVFDCDGQISEEIYTLTAQTNTLTFDATSTNASTADCDGTITITNPTGGILDYSYSISLPNQSAIINDNGVFTNVCAGTYSVVVSDNGGCSKDTMITITGGDIVPDCEFNISAAISQQPTTLCNGMATVTFTGVNTDPKYTWRDVNQVIVGTEATISTLCEASIYYVSVEDQATGCIRTTSVTTNENINVQCDLTIGATLVESKCADGSDGSISLTIEGGTTSNAQCYETQVTSIDDCSVCDEYLSGNVGWKSLNDGRKYCVQSGASVSGTLSLSNATLVVCGDLSGVNLSLSGGELIFNGNGPLFSRINSAWSNPVVKIYGQVVEAGTVPTLNIATIENYGTVTVPNYQVQGGTIFKNYGTMTNTGAFGVVGTLENYGTLDASEFTFSNGAIINNFCTLNSTNGVSLGGQLKNASQFTVGGLLTVSGQGQLTSDGGSLETNQLHLVGVLNTLTNSCGRVQTNSFSSAAGGVITGTLFACGIDNTSGLTVGPNVTFFNDCNNLSGCTGTEVIWKDLAGTEIGTGAILSNLEAGTYIYQITTSSGCIASDTLILNGALPLTATVEERNPVSCSDKADGVLEAIVSGGAGSYTYLWGPTSRTEKVHAPSIPDLYTLAVRDKNGCQALANRRLEDPEVNCCTSKPSGTLSVSATTSPCSDDGSLTLVPDQTDLRILWSTGVENVLALNNLAPDDYSVLLVDQETQCFDTLNKTVNVGTGTCNTNLAVSLSLDELPCNNRANGQLSVIINSEGTAPYTYKWFFEGQLTDVTTATNTEVQSGFYRVEVRDAARKLQTVTRYVGGKVCDGEENQCLGNLKAIGFPSSCIDEQEGNIIMTLTNGNSPIDFTWSVNGVIKGTKTQNEASYNLTGLPYGNYLVTVTYPSEDGTLTCTDYDKAWVGGNTPCTGCPELFTASVNIIQQATSDCVQDGQANVQINSVVPLPANGKYTYEWSTGSIDATVTNLGEGAQWVWVFREEAGVRVCSTRVPLLIAGGPCGGCTNAEPLVATYTPSPETFCGTTFNKDGAINLEVTGGCGDYTYVWSNGKGTQDVHTLSEGTYQVFIEDTQSGLTLPFTVVVGLEESGTCPIVSSPYFRADVYPTSCLKTVDGKIDLKVSPKPKTIQWTYPSGDIVVRDNLNNIGIGTYELLVTYEDGTTRFETYKVGTIGTCPPDPCDVSGIQGIDGKTSCEKGADATIEIVFTDVFTTTAPSIEWPVLGGTASFQDNLDPGTYQAIVRIPNCANSPKTVDMVVTAGEGACPNKDCELVLSPSNPLCPEMQTGNVIATFTGGEAPVFYNWEGTDAGPKQKIVSDLPAGKIRLTVNAGENGTGGYKCSVSEMVTLNYQKDVCDDDEECPDFMISKADIECAPNQQKLEVTPAANGGYVWNTGSFDQSIDVAAVGGYSVTVTHYVSGKTCSPKLTTTVSGLENISRLNIIPGDDYLCPNGTIVLEASGGFEGSIYTWNSPVLTNPVTGNTITITEAGTYSLSATNATGCAMAGPSYTVRSIPTAGTGLPTDISIGVTGALPNADGFYELCENSFTGLDLTSLTNANHVWKNESGETLGTQRSINIDELGTYTLEETFGTCATLSTSITVVGKENCPTNPNCDISNFLQVKLTEKEITTCEDFYTNQALYQARRDYEEYIDGIETSFRAAYIDHYLDLNETLGLKADNPNFEGQYTLYYYDQSGSLVRTVPPEGFRPIEDQNQITLAKQDIKNGTRRVFTEHEYVTTYTYNSLNQLIGQDVPDNETMDLRETAAASIDLTDYDLLGGSLSTDSRGVVFGTDVNNNGVLFYSTDGGLTWEEQKQLNLGDLNALGHVNDNTVLAGGTRGLLLRSDDGGQTWELKPSGLQVDFTDVYVANNIIYVLGTQIANSTTVLYTYNLAADSWMELTLPNQGTVKNIYTEGNELYAITSEGTEDFIFKATAGTTLNWQKQNLKTTVDFIAIESGNEGVFALKNNDGFIYKIEADGRYTIIREASDAANTSFALFDEVLIIQRGSELLSYDLNSTNITTIVSSNLTSWELIQREEIQYLSITTGTTQKYAEYEGGTWQVADFELQSKDQNALLEGEGQLAWTATTLTLYLSNDDAAVNLGINEVDILDWTDNIDHAWGIRYGDHSYTLYVVRPDGKLFRKMDGLASDDPDTPEVELTSPWEEITTGTIIPLSINFEDDGNLWVRDANNIYYYSNDLSFDNTTVSLDLSTYDPLIDLSLSAGKIALIGQTNTDTQDEVYLSNDVGQLIKSTYNMKGTDLEFGAANIAVGEDLYEFDGTDYYHNVILASAHTTAINTNTGYEVVSQDASTSFNYNSTTQNIGPDNTLSTAAVAGRAKTYAKSGSDSYVLTTANKVYFNNNGAWTEAEDGLALSASSTSVVLTGTESKRLYRLSPATNGWAAPEPEILNPINNAVITTGGKGVAVGDNGTILTTTNGGVSWTIANSTTGTDLFATGLKGNLAIAAGDGEAFVSLNEGNTWDPLSTPPNSPQFTDVAIQNSNEVYLTANIGLYQCNTTSCNLIPNTSSLNAVASLDANTKMAVGDNGAFYNYNGSTWGSLQVIELTTNTGTVQVTQNLTDVYITDDRTAWITGVGGLLLKTTNGGQSWVQYFENGEAGTDNILAIDFQNRENGAIITTNGVNTLEDETDRFAAKFWYDELGRLVLSQNSKQRRKEYSITGDAVEGCFSYTLFDDIGRTTEVGEVCPTATTFASIKTLLKTSTQIPEARLLTMLALNANRRYEVTQTLYDDIRTYAGATDIAGTLLTDIPNFEPRTELLRNRVAAALYSEKYQGPTINVIRDQNYNHATYYDYDIHGNVKACVEDQPILAALENRYKRTDYSYDLISGNVLGVAYQKGEIDQFYHRYEYDADNRITQVETSNNGVIWDKDAKYNYYHHGPLAQKVMGDQEIQSLEHVYTLQGWLKTVNGENRSTPNLDNNALADEMGYALGYYENDYKAVGGVTATANVANARPTGFKQNLYNGNISEMATNIKYFDGNSGANVMQYKYDQLNRLVAAAQVDNGTANANYNVNLTYDRNGNIETLKRTDDAGALFDDFSYTYKDKTDGFKRSNNQLRAVSDAVSGSNPIYGDLPSGQQLASASTEDNYQYDAIGNLITDVQEDIDTIIWRVDGKIKEIRRTNQARADKRSDLIFGYSAMGRRVYKLEKPRDPSTGELLGEAAWKYTHYFCDASGNPMAIYTQSYDQGSGTTYTEKLYLDEQHLYGSSKCGIFKPQLAPITERTFNADLFAVNLTGNTNQTENRFTGANGQSPVALDVGDIIYRSYGNKYYQLSNHLGNVLAVVSDLKIIDNGAYTTTTLAATDYYPFGMTMPNRTFSSPDYRYGFNGKEKDDEVKGSGAHYDYGFRVYDPRIAKFLSVDPLASTYPFYTPYQFAGNTPIQAIDLDGLEPAYVIDKAGKLTKPMVAVLNAAFLYSTVQLNKAEWVPYTKDVSSKAWAKVVGIPGSTSASVNGYRVVHDGKKNRSALSWFSLVSHEHSHLQDMEESSVSSFYAKYLAEGSVKSYRDINTEKKAYTYGSSSGSGLSKKLWNYKGGQVSKVLSSATMSEADKVKSMEALGNQFRRDVILQAEIDQNNQIIAATQKYLNSNKNLSNDEIAFNKQVMSELTKENTTLQNKQNEITAKYGK